MAELPTVACPRRHLDTYGGSGYLYVEEGRWILEHCWDGHWGGCAVGDAAESLHRVEQRVIGHLERAEYVKRHRMRYPARLAGVTHAPWPKTGRRAA